MIARLEGWGWELRADRVVLTSDWATIQYAERLRPLERVGDLVAYHTRGWSLHTVDPPEQLLTAEGEFAAMIEIEAVLDATVTSLVLGFVFGDDSYAYLEARANPAHAARVAAIVRRLVISDRHGLGVRRRRYLFQPPTWQGLSLASATTHYLAPHYPRDPSRITVYPAVPLAVDAAPTIDLQRTLGEDLLVTEVGPSSGFRSERTTSGPIAVRSGLAGTRWRVTGQWDDGSQIEREIVFLRDARFGYVVELVTDARHAITARTEFEGIVESVCPIPVPRENHSAGPAFSHWAD